MASQFHKKLQYPEFPLTHMCAYMTQKNIKGCTFFGAHASQGPTKTGYYPDIFATVLENPHDPPFCSRGHVFTENAIMTFFSLQQRNQVKLHLLDRKESLIKILRRFWDPRNVFFLPNGSNKFNLLTCFPALPPCNYYTNTHPHTDTHTQKLK